MFAQELVLAHETIEDGKNYESIVRMDRASVA